MELIIIICLVAFVAVCRDLKNSPSNKSKLRFDSQGIDTNVKGVQIQQFEHIAETGFYSGNLFAAEAAFRAMSDKTKR